MRKPFKLTLGAGIVLAFIFVGAFGLFTAFTQNSDREFRRFGIDQMAAIGIGGHYTVAYEPCGNRSEIPPPAIRCTADMIVCDAPGDGQLHQWHVFSALDDADAVAVATERKPRWCELGRLYRGGRVDGMRMPDVSNRIEGYGD